MMREDALALEAELANLQSRQQLADQVCTLLQADPRVVTVSYYGSIAAGSADRYSDIDIEVRLQNTSDRAFAEALPELLQPVGATLVEAWSVGALPDLFARTFYFTEYPLFWHVDIACKSSDHVDGADLKQMYHWSQIYKIWVDVLSNFLRGRDTTPTLDTLIERWADISVIRALSPAAKLSRYLDLCDKRARNRGAPREAFYKRCDQLRKAYLVE
jgi:predicted nucleotidyltransferase